MVPGRSPMASTAFVMRLTTIKRICSASASIPGMFGGKILLDRHVLRQRGAHEPQQLVHQR